MNPLLMALLAALLIPFFVGTWRTSLLALSSQGFLMAWIAMNIHPAPSTAGDWLTLVDLIGMRGILTPLLLRDVLVSKQAPSKNDVIPPNLLYWTIALGVVLAAFKFSGALVGEPGQLQTLVAVAVAGIMLGFFVLATRSNPFSQMMGALRIENAIALLELGIAGHHEPLALKLGQMAVFVGTVALFRWYLAALVPGPAAAAGEAPEGPTL